MRPWTSATPRAGTFARAGKTPEAGSDGGPLATLPAAVHGRMWRHDVRPPSDSGNAKEKNPRPVSRRGLLNSCDDEDIPVICPTCQMS